MRTMTNQRACRGTLILVFLALVILAGVRPGIAEDDDQAGGRQLTPDLSGVSSDERSSIESACASEKMFRGPAAYNRCLASQLSALGKAPMTPDLSGVSSDERSSIESACASEKMFRGPAAYNRCLASQLSALGKAPMTPGLSGVSSDERSSIAKDQDIAQLRQASEDGDADAQFGLGVMYANGEGVLENYVKAYAWWNLAGAQGHKDAIKAKASLRKDMTTEQVAEAQKLSVEIHNRIESSKSK